MLFFLDPQLMNFFHCLSNLRTSSYRQMTKSVEMKVSVTNAGKFKKQI